jgi:hydroxyacylglutathione hydrolase
MPMSLKRWLRLDASGYAEKLLSGSSRGALVIDFSTRAPIEGNLAVKWIHGSKSRRRNTDPPIQVHAYDEHTYILRQSKAVHYEAPFMYLFFGNERALLLDTGATKEAEKFPLRAMVDGIVDGWLEINQREAYELVVVHSHGHGDHVAADDQFENRPHTRLVKADDTKEFFKFAEWPQEVVQFDLGGRMLDITGIPGHDERSIAVFDPWSGFLLTGDSVLPGRLYAQDMAQFARSMQHLVEFAEAHPVTHVMGCHIEQSRTPRRDYHIGCTYQPNEVDLQLSMAQLREMRDATMAVKERPGIHVFDYFSIYNGMPTTAKAIGLVIKTRARNALNRP